MAKRKNTRKKKRLDPEEKQNLPYIPLYTGDYIKNTRSLSLESKGAWIDMILQMWDTKSKGVLIGTIDDFTRSIGSTSSEQTARIITELAMKKVADVSKDENDLYYTVTCRRLAREAKISEVRTNAVQNRYKTRTKDDTKSVQNTDNENEYEVESEVDSVPYGKSENYFLGNVPDDLLKYVSVLLPSSLDSEKWQRLIAKEIQALGYRVHVEVKCSYPDENAVEVEGFIDIRAVKGSNVVAIECDNRVTTRDSVVKIQNYANQLDPTKWNYSGMVLLRDPKPVHIAATVAAKPLVRSSTASKVHYPFDSEDFRQWWARWLEYRRDIKKPYKSPMSEQAALKMLSTLGEEKAIAMINNSITQGYQGLYEAKNGTAKTTPNRNIDHARGIAEDFARRHGDK